ncbi:MAG: glycosyltransferase [Candidatus Omnitrophica bacterium]|nr:glycosyltransferase [Candidatus Omnitrophota bacterium]
MDLSIVLPAYNCKNMAERHLRILHDHLAEVFAAFEILVVDDGSRAEERLDPAALPATVRVIQLEKNCGKGAAVCRGMLEAKGAVRIFTDIDLPYELAAIPYAYALIKDKGFHFVAGDRFLPSSKYSNTLPFTRQIASRIFSKFVTLFIIGGIYDSQCGFKAFAAPLAEALFPLLTIKRFSFDVEIYYLLLKYNIVIRRIPVCLHDQERSTVNLLKHSIPMACRIMTIPFKWYSGKYSSGAMRKFLDGPYWEKAAS